MIVFAIAIATVLGFLITIPVIILLHELGHAFAYLLLTKQKRVDIYVGSRTVKASKINFHVNKLYFHFNFTFLKGGCCAADSSEKNYVKQIIILLAGPLFSFVIICLFSWVVFNSELHGAIKLYFFILIICATINTYSNLKGHSKSETSDGAQLRLALKLKKNYANYILAIKAYNSGQYELAAEKFAIVVKLVPYDTKILRLLIDALRRADFVENTEGYLIALQQYSELKIDEMLSYGYILAVSGRINEANVVFDNVLKQSPDNLIALTNLGYGHAMNGDLPAAACYLEKAIELDETQAAPYSMLGYVELLKNNLENGRQLIEKSLAMDPTYSYSYRNLAYYYLKLGDKEKARLNINHAAFMDRRIDLKPIIKELESMTNSDTN